MARWPVWLPEACRVYLRHTQMGHSIREIARHYGCEPSTISRRIQRIESKRDDVLIDRLLVRISRSDPASLEAGTGTEDRHAMSRHTTIELPDQKKFEQDAMRVLRRLAEPTACLALAEGMENAVVAREVDGGPAVRTAVISRVVAEGMAMKDWIEGSGAGKILRYKITSTGRTALRELLAKDESRRAMSQGLATISKNTDDAELGGDPKRRRAKYTIGESPLVALSRRRDKAGNPFLTDDLVAAGERMREDFELTQVDGRTSIDWEKYLGGDIPEEAHAPKADEPPAVASARARVLSALEALGPGLREVALHCCCRLEGLEQTEQRMGWSARSGKIVLRIALQRLKLHYDTHSEHWSPLIG